MEAFNRNDIMQSNRINAIKAVYRQIDQTGNHEGAYLPVHAENLFAKSQMGGGFFPRIPPAGPGVVCINTLNPELGPMGKALEDLLPQEIWLNEHIINQKQRSRVDYDKMVLAQESLKLFNEETNVNIRSYRNPPAGHPYGHPTFGESKEILARVLRLIVQNDVHIEIMNHPTLAGKGGARISRTNRTDTFNIGIYAIICHTFGEGKVVASKICSINQIAEDYEPMGTRGEYLKHMMAIPMCYLFALSLPGEYSNVTIEDMLSKDISYIRNGWLERVRNKGYWSKEVMEHRLASTPGYTPIEDSTHLHDCKGLEYTFLKILGMMNKGLYDVNPAHRNATKVTNRSTTEHERRVDRYQHMDAANGIVKQHGAAQFP